MPVDPKNPPAPALVPESPLEITDRMGRILDALKKTMAGYAAIRRAYDRLLKEEDPNYDHAEDETEGANDPPQLIVSWGASFESDLNTGIDLLTIPKERRKQMMMLLSEQLQADMLRMARDLKTASSSVIQILESAE